MICESARSEYEHDGDQKHDEFFHVMGVAPFYSLSYI